jgi:hypothetical protein
VVLVALGAHEGAELAVDVADIGVIDVAVDDVGDDLVAAPFVGRALALAAARVGQFAQFRERRVIELLRLLGRDPLAGDMYLRGGTTGSRPISTSSAANFSIARFCGSPRS